MVAEGSRGQGGPGEAGATAAVKQEPAEQPPEQRRVSHASPDGFGSSCASISGLTGEAGTVTRTAEAGAVAETGLRGAAGACGGRPASSRGIRQWGLCVTHVTVTLCIFAFLSDASPELELARH